MYAKAKNIPTDQNDQNKNTKKLWASGGRTKNTFL